MPDSLEDQTPLKETMCCQLLTSTTLSQRFRLRNELQVIMAWTVQTQQQDFFEESQRRTKSIQRRNTMETFHDFEKS
jgi:hypothetical protein